MGEVILSAHDVADLYGCTDRAIRIKINEGIIKAIESTNERNRPMYLIPLSSLADEFQRKYYKLHPPVAPLNPVEIKESVLKGKIIEWIDLLSEQQQAIILGQIAKML